MPSSYVTTPRFTLLIMDAKQLAQMVDFWPARLLITAVELDVFSHLSDWGDSNILASKLGANTEALERLLCALAGLEVLEHKDGLFRVPKHLCSALLPGPDCITGHIAHRIRLWQSWSNLTDVVLLGQSEAVDRTPRDHHTLKRFIGAMAVSGRNSAEETAKLLPLAVAGTVLDVGGGPAIYAETFCKTQPGLCATQLDIPPVCELAQERLEDSPIRQRIKFIEGDALEVEPEAVAAASNGGFGLVFMSNLIHSMGRDEVRELFRRCCIWTRPGGTVVVKDFFLDDTRTKPVRNALFAINMLVGTTAGNSYTWREAEEWLRDAAGARLVGLERKTLRDGNSGIIMLRLE